MGPRARTSTPGGAGEVAASCERAGGSVNSAANAIRAAMMANGNRQWIIAILCKRRNGPGRPSAKDARGRVFSGNVAAAQGGNKKGESTRLSQLCCRHVE